MKKGLITLLLLSALSTSGVMGQELWSLERCIQYAWENNIQIRQQELVVEQNKNNVEQAKYNFVPSVNASVSENMNWGRSVNLNDLEIITNQLSASTSASLGASIRILDGLSKPNTLKSNQKSLEISMQDVQRIKNDISINIARAYLQIMLSQQIFNSATESFNSMLEQRNRSEKLVNAGSQAYSTLLEMDAQLANERVRVVEAENQLTITKLTLMQLLDLGSDVNFDIVIPGLPELPDVYNEESIDILFRQSLSLPQIKSAELTLERSKLQLNIAKGRLYPTISLNASYGSYFSNRNDDPFFTQFNDNRNPSMGLSLSIPILNNLQTRINLKNARLNVTNYELDLQSKHQDLYKEIQTAASDAKAYHQRYLASKQNLTAMEESFRYVEEKFNIGVLNGTDYTVAKNNLFAARSNYYQSIYQFIFQSKILDFYRGIPLSL